MKVFCYMDETWQAEYAIATKEYDAVAAEVPQHVWDRLRSAEKELDAAREAIEYFPGGGV